MTKDNAKRRDSLRRAQLDFMIVEVISREG
jgi:hypothetical protein